jgi:NADPH-dependent F420 reductase
LTGTDNASACQGADVVVLSIPYSAHAATLTELKAGLQGALVVDITVPLKPPAVRTVHLPEGRSTALEAQALLGPGVRVVAAMHHVSAVHLADIEHAIDCDVLACSDDAAALETALSLIADLGVRAFDAGPLANAVALESLTPVLLHMNKRYKGVGVGVRFTGV